MTHRIYIRALRRAEGASLSPRRARRYAALAAGLAYMRQFGADTKDRSSAALERRFAEEHRALSAAIRASAIRASAEVTI